MRKAPLDLAVKRVLASLAVDGLEARPICARAPIDATHADGPRFGSLAGGEAGAMSESLSRLFDDVAPFVIPLLPLDARARAACTRKAWCAAASDLSLWAELSFENCAVQVTDATLAALCARAGPALRSLRLDSCACRQMSGAGLVAALSDGRCAGLQRLYAELYGRRCELTPALVAKLVTACQQLERTECSVVCTRLDDAVQAVAALPGQLKLRIHSEDGRPAQTASAARGLLHCSVTLLRVQYCNLVRWDATAFGEALRVNNTLTHLCLFDNGIDGGMAWLGEALRVNRTLTYLEIVNNRVGDDGAAALGVALRTNNTLKWLELTACGIGDHGAAALGEALSVNRTLTDLDLGRNRLGAGGVVALSEALRVNTTLKILNLSDNGTWEDGAAVALAAALRMNRSLTMLNLCHNQTFDTVAISLAEALRVNNSLLTLDLGGNGIGDAGAVALCEALRVNQALELLDISNNGIGAFAEAALGEMRRHDRHVILGDQFIDDDGAAAG